MIFLRDDPVAINSRRANDPARARVKKNVDALASIQGVALAHAEHICRTLGVPLHVITPADIDEIEGVLVKLGSAESA